MLQLSETLTMQNTAQDRFLLLDHLQHEAAAPRKWSFNIIHTSLDRESVLSTSLALLCLQSMLQGYWTNPRLLALSLMSPRKRGFNWWNQINGYSQTSAIIMTGQKMHQWKVTLQAGHCAILYWEVGISLLTFPQGSKPQGMARAQLRSDRKNSVPWML